MRIYGALGLTSRWSRRLRAAHSGAAQRHVRRHVKRSGGFLVMLMTLHPAVGIAAEPKDDEIKKALDALDAHLARQPPSRLNAEILSRASDLEVESMVFDFVLHKINGRYEIEREIISGLAPGTRAFYLTWVVETEVNNGGFNQYYFNTSGMFASEAVGAFEYFGANKHAAVMKEANEVRAKEASAMAQFKDRGTVDAFVESYEHSKLAPIDKKFQELSEDLSRLRVARIRQHPEEFTNE